VSQYNLFSNVWWVVMQSDAQFRQNPEDLTRSTRATPEPDGAAVVGRHDAVDGRADLLPHFNGFTAAKIIGSAAPGYSSGDAIATMESSRRSPAAGYTFAWSASRSRRRSPAARRASRSSSAHHRVLVLAAQYESWTLPGAVMTAVPFGILGALLTNHLRGLDNDVYFRSASSC
jgi:multidrug efflux pump